MSFFRIFIVFFFYFASNVNWIFACENVLISPDNGAIERKHAKFQVRDEFNIAFDVDLSPFIKNLSDKEKALTKLRSWAPRVPNLG